MNLLSQILQWIFRSLRLNVKRYPAKLYHKTRADFIAKIHEKIDKTNKSDNKKE